MQLRAAAALSDREHQPSLSGGEIVLSDDDDYDSVTNGSSEDSIMSTTTHPTKKNPFEIASLWRRVFANILDYIFYLLFGFLVISSIATVAYLLFGSAAVETMPLIGVVCLFVGFFAWEILFICSRRQATPGKQTLGLKVVTKSGKKLTLDMSCLRFIVKYIGPFYGWLGWLWALGNHEKQTWHDIAAESYVVLDDGSNPI